MLKHNLGIAFPEKNLLTDDISK